MPVVLGLLASVAYGIADFLGGVVSRRNHVLTVVVWVQIVGVVVASATVPLLTDAAPTREALSLGAAAGVAGMFGAALLFRGLARGRMAVVAPLTALLTASLPFVIGILSGERPSSVSLLGLLMALAAIGLVSTAAEPGVEPRPDRSLMTRMAGAGIPEAVGAGIFFAGFFLLFDLVEDDAGVWPIVGARTAALVIGGVVLMVARLTLRPARGTTAGVLSSGLAGNVADYLFVVGTRLGLLSVVVVLTSLYPATTVVLARTFLKERIARLQLVGLVLAAAGVVLLTIG